MAQNPYITNPSNIMPGLQMLSQSVQRRADFERERVKAGQEQKVRDEAAQLFKTGTPEEIAEEIADYRIKHPEVSKNIEASYKFKSEQTRENKLDSLRRILIDGEPAAQVLLERADVVEKEGGDYRETLDDAKEAMVNEPGAYAKALKEYSMLASKDEWKQYQQGQGKEVSPGVKKQKTAAFLVKGPDGKTQITVGSYDTNTGKLVAEGAELPEGYELVSKLGETGKEETTRKIGQKKGEKIVAGQESRATSLIDRGITAAESTATIRRGIELLDSVKTGGYNNAALRAKQIFGIESANEGELSNSLGKSVLSQLRETFGAAFTENEGNRLARIEAAFGKSPEANKRLLQQALRLSERTAKRARDAAYKREDMDTVNDINDLLNFTLSDPDIEKEEPAPPKKQGPTLQDFILKATQANPGASEQELTEYYNKKYGGL